MSELTRQLNSNPRQMIGRYADRRRMPVLGEVAVPSPDKLAYYAGLGVLAALQVIEWPVAVVITAGHLLAEQHFSGLAKSIGEALESI